MGLRDLFGARTPSVHADEALGLVRGEAVLLDVRESAEWNAGHAPTAVHLPLGRLTEASRRLPSGRRVVVVCRSGNRSRLATRQLREQGFDAVNLAGGMHAWRAAGGSVVDRKNRPGTIA